ncbi:hypothetical protein [Xanthomonas sp. 3075]|uniref:hypothetical protein n=1 Tax=Xanthomonas sp. 3075 TaxID=3035315 RepID=UPI0017C30BAA|nr:hypothetical protein [Xanthomonas sp. 3075]MBB4131877.1 hypothetical protein [Xanthomonas sp. 3075]
MPHSSFRLFMPLALLGLLVACSGGSAPDATPRPASEHVNLDDLRQLGCSVAATPKRDLRSIPLMGQIDGYGFTSTTPCATQLVSLLQSAEYEDAAWEGARTAARSFAKQHGFEQDSGEGRIGEYSEIEIFSRNGTPVGFEYSVQAKGRLHSVILLSDSIAPDAAFEAVLTKKL